MDLLTYISDMDRRAALAKALITSPQYLWQIANRWKGRQASPGLAQRIEEATAGQVDKSSLRPDIWPPIAKPARRRAA